MTTELHLSCDGRGRPLAIVLSPGQRHDSTQLESMLDGICVPRLAGRGRPRKCPDQLLAKRGGSSKGCRRLLRHRDIRHTIPQWTNQRAYRVNQRGRKPAFDRATYRRRNVVERGINRLKHYRAIATRYAKRAANYPAMVVIASTMIWLGS